MFTTLISEAQLYDAINDRDLIIFDARYDLMDKHAGKHAYQEGHIPGAIYVDLYDDLSRPPVINRGRHPLPAADTMMALFSELGISADKQVVIYDDASGSFAARLWWMLRYMQHRKVAVLDGGWQAWLSAGRSVNAHTEARVAAEFSGSPLNNNIVDIDAVDKCPLIIDSRDPARYSGEIEPIDKVAGHIPGAINRFWQDNLSETGYFKEERLLKAEFEALLGQMESEDAVFYCGSGVTACHNLLAVAHAGLSLSRLYPGSWSEWSSTPGKAVATGL